MTGMSLIVKTIVRFLFGFIFVFSVSIVLYGHITPGGGFGGGVMLACGWILFLLAFGREEAVSLMRETVAGVLDSAGALAFLVIALLGLVSGKFFLNFLPQGENYQFLSSGMIPLANLAILVKVAAGLAGVFLALAAFHIARSGERRPMGIAIYLLTFSLLTLGL